MNKSYSLHKIIDKDNCPFEEKEYSRFKFGDKFYAEKFAKDLFAGFVDQFGELILSGEDIVILLVLICPYQPLQTFYVTTSKRN